jgi:uncharacterized membrane protein YphA (DoxX/SURF4 family)
MLKGRSDVYAVRALAFMLGLFFLFNGLDKLAWFSDPGILAARLEGWLKNAPPSSRWYIETLTPGVPLFARLVPLAELSAGVALIIGFWARVTAALAFFMVLNFHFARGFIFDPEFLMDGTGFPVLGGLIVLALGRWALPFSVSKS